MYYIDLGSNNIIMIFKVIYYSNIIVNCIVIDPMSALLIQYSHAQLYMQHRFKSSCGFNVVIYTKIILNSIMNSCTNTCSQIPVLHDTFYSPQCFPCVFVYTCTCICIAYTCYLQLTQKLELIAILSEIYSKSPLSKKSG